MKVFIGTIHDVEIWAIDKKVKTQTGKKVDAFKARVGSALKRIYEDERLISAYYLAHLNK